MVAPAKPAAPEKLPNGAVVTWTPWPVAKWAIFDGLGHLCGHRRSIEEARAFAATLPDRHWEPPVAAPINVSPRAHEEVRRRAQVPAYESPGQQPDEGPWPAKRPSVVLKYAAAKAMAGRGRRS
jgi:hypothetical protein